MSATSIKKIILTLLKLTGFFWLSKQFFKNKILILAYHGIEIDDESSFNPNLFIKANTLNMRLNYLKEKGFNVLSLTDALTKRQLGTLPAKAVVLTFDDGWYSTKKLAAPVLNEMQFPYTIYVTSYYVEKRLPVLNVLLRYVFYKTNAGFINTAELGFTSSERLTLASKADKDKCFELTLERFSALSDSNERYQYVLAIANKLNVDLTSQLESGCFRLMTANELEMLSADGADLQLHTHKHNVDLAKLELLEPDIIENKQFLINYSNAVAKHFCYPSGVHNGQTAAILANVGIESATTCIPGFVTKNTNCYYLPRFLDGENISQLLFEAEVCGVLEFFRNSKTSINLLLKR